MSAETGPLAALVDGEQEKIATPEPAQDGSRGPTTYIVLVHVESEEPDGVRWEEAGKVEARTRAAALDALEGRFGQLPNVRLHLIPERFWQEIVGEQEPPAPPRIRWSGA